MLDVSESKGITRRERPARISWWIGGPANICWYNVPLRFRLEAALRLAEIRQDRIDELKGLVDLLTDFRTGKNNLARDENEQDNLWLHHAVDETREQFRLVRAEHVMARCQTLETDRKLDVAGADNVLDLKVGELCVEAELLNDASVFPRCQLGVIFGFRTSDDHLSTCKDQSGCLWLTDTHNDGGKTLRID